MGDDEQSTHRWRAWSADVRLNLAGADSFVPRDVAFGIAQEHKDRVEIGSLDAAADLDELSRSLSLQLNWDHHGGATTLQITGSDFDDRAHADGDSDTLDYAFRLKRAFDSGPWTLSAEAGLVGKSVIEGEQRQRSRALDFGFNMKSKPGFFGSLGFEAGISLIDESDHDAPSLNEATFGLTYDLQF